MNMNAWCTSSVEDSRRQSKAVEGGCYLRPSSTLFDHLRLAELHSSFAFLPPIFPLADQDPFSIEPDLVDLERRPGRAGANLAAADVELAAVPGTGEDIPGGVEDALAQ